MSDQDAVKGLTCPRCGGTVAVPEGQIIVVCPYCEQRSVVAVSKKMTVEAQGQNAQTNLLSGFSESHGTELPEIEDQGLGVRRYQAPLNVNRDQAVQEMKQFLSGKIQVARDAASSAQIAEAFVVYLPFWAVWGRGVAYAFGQVKVGSGNDAHYEPREKKIMREMSWNLPACEVGEFGVQRISMDHCPMQPFNADELHRLGMVFEPVGSEQEALAAAQLSFRNEIQGEIHLDRTAQVFTRLLKPRLGLLYYPMWIIRYLYHGRAFQVAVDGVDGKILYGKAPGSVGYRAGALVGGMAVGSVVTIDIPGIILLTSDSSHNDDNPFVFGAILFFVGLGILWLAYRTFRYSEHYEYHRYKAEKGTQGISSLNLPGVLKDVNSVIREVEKYSS